MLTTTIALMLDGLYIEADVTYQRDYAVAARGDVPYSPPGPPTFAGVSILEIDGGNAECDSRRAELERRLLDHLREEGIDESL